MAGRTSINIDFAALAERVQAQFRGLNPKDPSTWRASGSRG